MLVFLLFKGGVIMDYSGLAQFISSVGFPICAFVAIFYLYDKTVKDLTTTINKIDNTLQHILNHLELEEEKNA